MIYQNVGIKYNLPTMSQLPLCHSPEALQYNESLLGLYPLLQITVAVDV